MKILKYALGIIAALIIIFLTIGLLIPSISYQSQVQIQCSG